MDARQATPYGPDSSSFGAQFDFKRPWPSARNPLVFSASLISLLGPECGTETEHNSAMCFLSEGIAGSLSKGLSSEQTTQALSRMISR